MEYLSEDRLKLMLHKEWLSKIDSNKSVPYLLKFYSSTVDQCCCIMITDTKEVWGEVLTSKQFARRWRECNPTHAPSLTISDEEEDEWRSEVVELLSSVHTLGGVIDLSFDVVESRNADFAFELGSSEFKWRWETYSLGPKVSADVISKHLVMPLISVTHLVFASADPVRELSEADLEKAVDKVGRTARRTVDTHVKNAISKPRVATTLRRMTAMFNFLPDMPPILSDVEAPKFKLPAMEQRSRAPSKPPHVASATSPPGPSIPSARVPSEEPPSRSGVKRPSVDISRKQAADEDSETERSSDEGEQVSGKGKANDKPLSSQTRFSEKKGHFVAPAQSSSGAASPSLSRGPPQGKEKEKEKESEPLSDTDMSSSPVRPTKKAKKARDSSSSSDEDSEAERKRRIAQLKGSSSRGAKQPLKRGGRRF